MRKKFAALAGALLSAGALAAGLSTVMSGSAQASVSPDRPGTRSGPLRLSAARTGYALRDSADGRDAA